MENQKEKVVFIMGATGTGKSRLSVDLASHFPAEIINSDKMQVYKGLEIVTNKISDSERKGVPHHLLGEIDPDSDFTAGDFCNQALSAIKRIVKSGLVPIIVGGSNSFIEALVEDPLFNFRSKYECCFLWVDVSLPVLDDYVSKRVDQMVDAGLVEEIRGIFDPEADYTRGIRRSIGVPELDKYFRAEMQGKNNETAANKILLEAAIDEIKSNTSKLIRCQLEKIHRLRNELGWEFHWVNATRVFEKQGKEAEDAWGELVLQPSLEVVNDFLKENDDSSLLTNNHIHPSFEQLQVAN